MTLDSLKTLAKARGSSRREFIQRAIAAGIAVSSAEGLFAAMARAEPKKGGRFRLALGSGSITDTLDPGIKAKLAEFRAHKWEYVKAANGSGQT